MEVRNLHPSAAAPARAHRTGFGQADEPLQGGARHEDGRPRLRIVSDRVLISQSARTALDEMRGMPEVEFGIRSRMAADPLPEERAGELRMRMDEGFYKQPSIMHEVAGVVTGVLEYEL